MTPRGRSGRPAETALLQRIAELEDRLRTLERQISRGERSKRRLPTTEREPPAPSTARCPGCLLDLPPGPRGAECVWCGFIFAAARPSRPKGVRRRRRDGMQGPRGSQDDPVPRS